MAPRTTTKIVVMFKQPVSYISTAKRIADRRIILAGYRLADLLMRVAANELKKRSRVAETAVPKQKESHILPVFLERKNLAALSTSIELAATSSHQPAPVP